MFKKFLNGIVFGAGFGIAFIAVVVIYFQFFFQPMMERKFDTSNEVIGKSNKVIGKPPAIKDQQRFLGSPAIHSVGFMGNKGSVLSGGPGKIIGKALLNNSPVSGLKLRLALNGSVMSQWATTDAEGQYTVSVPYGKYKIDGFELDTTTADSVLAGKIDHPQNAHSSGTFEVQKDSHGRGLTFRFVNPIKKNISKKKFSISESVVLNWTRYPGASQYSIQIYENSDPHAYIGQNAIFDWSKRPRISSTSFNLKEHGVEIKAGHFYVVEIDAEDDRMGIISQTARVYTGYDFEVVD